MAGEKKFGTSLFGFQRADVNAYIERIIREFEQRLKEKDEEIAGLKLQLKDLKTKYEEIHREAEAVMKEKKKIAGVLLEAHEKAEAMMKEAREKAMQEKNCLDQVLEAEREKIVDIKRDLKAIKKQAAEILSRFDQQIDDVMSSIHKSEKKFSDNVYEPIAVSNVENPAV